MEENVREIVPRTQAHAAAGRSFLDLPAEVRIMIYRLLLVANKPLGSSDDYDDVMLPVWVVFGEYQLQPAILRTCRQLHHEASPILNGENTYGIEIFANECYEYSDEEEIKAETLIMDFEVSRGMDYIRKHIPSINNFQRVEIMIQTDTLELEVAESAVKKLCSSILCNMAALHHISIILSENPSHRKNHSALRPFGMLQNVRNVVFNGVPHPFAERLKGLMLGNTPQMNVEGMYGLLKSYVHDPKGTLLDLQEASNALQELDFQNFGEIRSKILSDGQRCMEDALLHIFDHDPKNEGNEAAIEDNFDHKVAENYDSQIEEDHDGELGDH